MPDDSPTDRGDQVRGARDQRASNAEREAVVTRLHTASSEGRLTLEEIDERTGAAYGARYRRELAELLVDLPPETATSREGWRRIWDSIVLQVNTSLPLPAATSEPGAAPSPWLPRIVTALAVVLFLWLAGWIVLGFALGMS